MPRIEHVVVLMLENRSFDNLLGWLYPDRPDFDGLTGSESNPLTHADGRVELIGVWNSAEVTPESACMPDPDPGELFADITMQIFGLHGRPGEDPPAMSGFVDNYARLNPRPRDVRQIMHYFTPAQVPVISGLARAFGVSDRWFSSAPCQTWPNRLFAHAGSAGGRVDNWAIPVPFFLPSVFRRLDKHGKSWRVYFHDLPQTAALADLWPRIGSNFRLFEEFEDDAARGCLPHYSFIEPRYYPSSWSGEPPNDEHPPHNMAYGEQLIAACYNALRAGPNWDGTLLLVTFDEHGGCYDHVPPPAAVSPGPPYTDGFRFDRFGPRVPAVIASPLIPAGSIIRPPDEARPFDHTSILATLHRAFDLGPGPNPRVDAAPDLLSALTLPEPSNRGPERLEATEAEADRRELRLLRQMGRNNHQKRLLHPASLIPGLTAKAAAHAHHKFRSRRRR